MRIKMNKRGIALVLALSVALIVLIVLILLLAQMFPFYLIGGNGFRLWIDDELVIDHRINDWEKEQTSKPVALTAGHKQSIKLGCSRILAARMCT